MFLVRVWTEEGLPTLRARITSSVDVAKADEQVTLVTTAEEIHEALDLWLRDFRHSS